jgi:hypothetical protein
LQVGVLRAGGVDFTVRDGLAAVRESKPGWVRLWAQSPAVVIDLTSSPEATTQWQLELSNCMPGAQLKLPALGISMDSLPTDRPTVCSYRVEIPSGASTTLVIEPPDTESFDRFTFGVVGDIQNAIKDVGDIYAVMNADPALRFVASTGDLTEQGSGAELDEVQQTLHGLRVPFFATVGNHELGSDPGQWFSRFGRASFHWSFHGAHVSFLDSGNAGIDPSVYDWLDDWLDGSRTSAHVVLTHFAPFDPVGTRAGAFRSTAEASKLMARLAAGKVDATFHGHVHSFYAFSQAGIPAYISGGGGAIPETMDGLGRHYLRVTVDPVSQAIEVSIARVD